MPRRIVSHDGLIVLVEDEPVVLEMLTRLVHRLVPGSTILTAHTAQELFVHLDRQAVSLAIVDYRLPGMDGLRLLQVLHAGSPQVRSLLISAVLMPELAEQAHAAGVDAFLAKPFNITELEQSIRSILP
jgi:two-component system C4-dicarboxylate transport response regulator DctD